MRTALLLFLARPSKKHSNGAFRNNAIGGRESENPRSVHFLSATQDVESNAIVCQRIQAIEHTAAALWLAYLELTGNGTIVGAMQ